MGCRFRCGLDQSYQAYSASGKATVVQSSPSKWAVVLLNVLRLLAIGLHRVPPSRERWHRLQIWLMAMLRVPAAVLQALARQALARQALAQQALAQQALARQALAQQALARQALAQQALAQQALARQALARQQ